MKVYRGYNNEVGPISYAHWIYVTPDIEQAKWYATKDGEVEDGDIIEYDLDVEHLRFLSLNKLNSLAQDENEIYTAEDLLWYQEGLGESLYKYVAGIVFKDPHSKRDHTIYIVFSQDHLKNGRVLSKEEFEKIELQESNNNGGWIEPEPETPPDIGDEKTYYRGEYMIVVEHILDDEEEYYHIYVYKKSRETYGWHEIKDTVKHSWEDCLFFMDEFGKEPKPIEPPEKDGSEYLDETVRQVNRELANTLLVTSAYELNEIIKNNKERRILYDKKNNWFLVGDPETSIHIHLLSDALQDGYYQPFEWNGEMIDGSNENDGGVLYDLHPNDFVLFRTSSDSLNGEDYYYDRYQYCYIYKDYCVFDRKGDFEGTPLYNYLGEPIDIENNGNVLEDEGINEQLNEYTIKRRQGIEFVGYHGSKEPDMTPREKSPLYLCDDYKLALAFAKGEIQNDGLYYDEIPTIFTFKGRFDKPYYMPEDQYDDEGQDSNIDYEKWVDDGYDGIVVQSEGKSKYYIVLDTSKIRLVDKKEFPEYARGYVEENDNGLNESVIHRDDGEVAGYYTRSSRELLSIIDNKYKEDDIRVVYDIDRNIYMFSDTYSATHFNLILYMILFTNVYDDIPEIKNNKYENDEVLQDIIKSKIYLSTFKIFRNYTNDSDEEFINFLRNIPENATDGYDYGYVCKINGKLWAVCRDDEIGEAKQVPLLQNKTWFNLKDNTQINESVNLKNLNRLAGFYHYNSGNWEMLPRTEKQLDSVDDYEEYKNYCHDYTVEDLFEEDMIRFHIEDIGNVICTIESPYQYWIKPFIRKLYVKFPEEMAMVKKFEIEYYKEDGTREYRTLEV